MDSTAINGITPNMLWVFVVVLIGLCATGITVLTLYEKIQNLKEKKKKPNEEAHTDVMNMLRNDKLRLDAHEAALSEIRGRQTTLENGQRVTCAGVMALLDHALHDGNTDQMEQASEQINTYLLNK